MKPNFLVDENIGGSVIMSLREQGYTVHSIKEQYPGLSDVQIIDLANSTNSIIITEDTDFGELVFSYGLKSRGIILIRIKYSNKVSTKYFDQILESYSYGGIETIPPP